jgi:hypothetical protein
MDTAFVVPIIAKLFVFALFLSTPFAGFVLCLSVSKAGRGWILTIVFFVTGACLYIGCVYLLMTYIMAFRVHVFMAQFISMAIIASISYGAYLLLR